MSQFSYTTKMKFITVLVLAISLISCNMKDEKPSPIDYKNDPNISDSSGLTSRNNIEFLPGKYLVDSTEIYSFGILSVYYRCFKAPLLYNFYLGYENYRLLWLRSFHRPVLISIIKKNDITINTKILKSQPEFWTTVYLPKSNSAPSQELRIFQDYESAKIDFPKADSIIPPKQNIEIEFDTTITINKKQWMTFKILLDSCKFWSSEQYINTAGLDGADWILEGQTPKCYQFIFRWNPKGQFRKCCEYLIHLSSAKDEEIY
jgi:hypothetical protein